MATACYILHRGEVAVIVGGEEVGKQGDGSVFGDTCLLGLSQRRTLHIKINMAHSKRYGSMDLLLELLLVLLLLYVFHM